MLGVDPPGKIWILPSSVDGPCPGETLTTTRAAMTTSWWDFHAASIDIGAQGRLKAGMEIDGPP
jgi:hypothetical protein